MNHFATALTAGLIGAALWGGAAQAETALLARGRYLITSIGECSDCHSPRDKQGMLIPGKELTGAPVSFAPIAPMPWAPVAPPIRGLPSGWTETQFATFLHTGKRPNGTEPRPPMPGYRMDVADARAAAAYIKSLQ